MIFLQPAFGPVRNCHLKKSFLQQRINVIGCYIKNSFDIQKICNFFTAAGSPAIFKKYFHSVGCICMSCLAGIGIFRRFSGFVTYGRTVLGRIVFRSVI